MPKEITKSLDKFLIVSNQPLFQGLSPKEKTVVANRIQVVEYRKGDLIYKEGQKKDFFYIVITGRILLFRTKAKKHIDVEVLRKGDYFGMISLLTGRRHSVGAKVLNDSRMIKVGHEEFRKILNEIPRLAIHLSHTLSRRINTGYTGTKEVYQSTIVAVYSADELYTSCYARALSLNIVKESGKKVACISLNKGGIQQKQRNLEYISLYTEARADLIALLSSLTARYHFVILDIPKRLGKVEKSAIRQSDVWHIISESNQEALKRAKRLTKSFRKDESEVKFILRESDQKIQLLPQEEIYETLPIDEYGFNVKIRRIARATSGVLIGLALGSGGAIGLAQIGILEVLNKEKVPIDVVAGTSIGSLIGSLWAVGYNTKQITKIFATLDTRLKTLGLLDVTVPKKGIISGNNVRKFLKMYLGDKTFLDLKVPLRIVACDIDTRDEVVITNGKLVDAVMASIAIPGVFNPFVTKDGRFLVDGGVVNPLPISVLSKEGVKSVIAVNSVPSPEDAAEAKKREQNIFDIIVNSFYSMEYIIAKYASQEADIYMHPIPKCAAWYEFYRSREFIRFGKKYAYGLIEKLNKLLR